MPWESNDEFEPERGDDAAKPKRHRRTKAELEAAGYYDGTEKKEKADKAPVGRKPKSFAAEVAGLLVPINQIVRSVPFTANDALTDDELARAIEVGNLAAQRYPKVRLLLKQAESVTLAGAALSLAFSVGLRVAANHNLLPASIRDAIMRSYGEMPLPNQDWTQERTAEAFEQYQTSMNGGIPTVTPVFPSGR